MPAFLLPANAGCNKRRLPTLEETKVSGTFLDKVPDTGPDTFTFLGARAVARATLN